MIYWIAAYSIIAICIVLWSIIDLDVTFEYHDERENIKAE